MWTAAENAMAGNLGWNNLFETTSSRGHFTKLHIDLFLSFFLSFSSLLFSSRSFKGLGHVNGKHELGETDHYLTYYFSFCPSWEQLQEAKKTEKRFIKWECQPFWEGNMLQNQSLYCWLLLFSAILHSQADSLRSCTCDSKWETVAFFYSTFWICTKAVCLQCCLVVT